MLKGSMHWGDITILNDYSEFQGVMKHKMTESKRETRILQSMLSDQERIKLEIKKT